ncbi:hypothetical protein GCM10009787_28390 [Streptomyces bangladeshensis]|uniref:Uncharacterized protein n=1 Tax=Streptomyces bangladeshensis TaxID=295352 RepID=A0ABN3BHE7_9ACTN
MTAPARGRTGRHTHMGEDWAWTLTRVSWSPQPNGRADRHLCVTPLGTPAPEGIRKHPRRAGW